MSAYSLVHCSSFLLPMNHVKAPITICIFHLRKKNSEHYVFHLFLKILKNQGLFKKFKDLFQIFDKNQALSRVLKHHMNPE